MSKAGGLFRLSVSFAAVAVFAAVLVLLFSSFGSGQQGPPPCTPGPFVLRGTVLNSSFHNASSNNVTLWNGSNVNISIFNMSFSQFGEPQKVFINQTNTSSMNGSFILNTASGNCDTLYTLSVVAYNISTWNALEIGPTLPPVPKGALIAFMDNSTIYLQPAVTLNLTAWNGTAMVNFSNLIFDDALGFPISEDFRTLRFNTSIVVPRAKNYTIMMMRPPQFDPGDPNPFNLALPPQTISVQNASNYSSSQFVISINKSLAFALNTISGNITIDGSNSTAVNVTQIVVKLGIAGLVPPNSDLQISGGTAINQTPGGGNHVANYSATVMSSTSGIYQILEFYGANTSGMSSGGGEYFAYFSNFTVTGNIVHNLTLKKLAGNYSSVSSGSTTLNTSFVRINISDANGLPLDDAHTELKVDMVGHKTNFPTFRYMVDQLSGGIISLPILNGSNATLLVFNRQFAPLKFKLNVTNASREPNGIIKVTLNAFKPRKFQANGSFEDFSGSKAGEFRLTFMRNSAACNVFNASVESCRLFKDDFDAGGFNPLKVMATGKVNMLMEINTTGVKVYFIGVDMLASGPPEASMSDSALRADTNGSSYQELFKFGSAAPNIYDNVFVGMPYNYSRLDDSKQINFTIKELFDDTGSLAWNSSVTPNSSIPSEWSDYDTRWLNTTNGGMPCTSTEDANSTNATCFVNTTTNYVWISLPHFSDGQGGPQGSDSTPPAAPALINISATLGGNAMINWTDVSGETGESYIIFRSATNISTLWNNLTNYSGINYVINITNLTSTSRIGEGVQTYIDNITLNGSVFYYAVAAVDATGNLQNSSPTGGVNVSSSYNITINDTILPRSPTNLTLTASGATVTLTWLNVTQDVNGMADFYGRVYRIYRSAVNETKVNLSAGVNVTAANMTYLKNVTANSTTDTGLVGGNYHYAITTVDDAGNENVTVYVPSADRNYNNVSVTPSAGSGDGSSSGGGSSGGGGGGTPAPSEGTKVSKKWDALPAGTSTMNIANDKVSFKALDITTANSASNVEISVTALASKPTVKREVQGKVYQYIKIDKTNLRDADVSEVKIEFKVEKKWFDQNSGSIKNIILQRYSSDLWTSLDTVYKRSDTTDNYFESTSPGLSLFAVVLKPAAEGTPKPKANETPVNISAAAGNESGIEAAKGEKGGKASGKALLFAVIALAVLAVGGGAFFVIKKKGGGMGGFSFPNPFSRFGKGGRGKGAGGRGKSRDAEEAAEIVREYESQRSGRQERPPQQDQRGRPPEAFN
ncbi:PGF-pre-PGF domain-containing protein [Candidatus Woesearchaeota archaeon]|nr:PGF-pre-PGF domain-containing protein [Candidatus Woesearchaeota archaeon]